MVVYTGDYRKLSILTPFERFGLVKELYIWPCYRRNNVELMGWKPTNPLHVQLNSLWTKMKPQSHINKIEMCPFATPRQPRYRQGGTMCYGCTMSVQRRAMFPPELGQPSLLPHWATSLPWRFYISLSSSPPLLFSSSLLHPLYSSLLSTLLLYTPQFLSRVNVHIAYLHRS